MLLLLARKPSPRASLLDVADSMHRDPEITCDRGSAARISKGRENLGLSQLCVRRPLSTRHCVVPPSINVVIRMGVVTQVRESIISAIPVVVTTLHPRRAGANESCQHQHMDVSLFDDGASPESTREVRAGSIAARDPVRSGVAVTSDTGEISDAPLVRDLVEVLPSNHWTPCFVGHLHERTIA
jgi:hypothetical protein